MKFETPKKKRDDEKGVWLIVGILFTGTLIGIDFGYSSFDKMATAAIIGLWVFHGLLSLFWIVAMVKFNNPAFDWIRKVILIGSAAVAIIIAVHHAAAREDNQVIIDSRENAAKP